MREIPEKNIRTIFVVSLFIKAFDAILEVIGGIILFMPASLAKLFSSLTSGELAEDPTSFTANHIRDLIPYLSSNGILFGAFYLLSHGIIKLILVGGLLRRKLWMYPTAIVIFALFVIYQLYRFSYTHSIFMIVLTVFDLFLIALTWHEYRFMKKGIVT